MSQAQVETRYVSQSGCWNMQFDRPLSLYARSKTCMVWSHHSAITDD